MLVDPELESQLVICDIIGSVLNTHFDNAVRMKYITEADALAHSLKSKDSTSFWKDVRKMPNSKILPASNVGDVVGSAKITKM